MNVKTAVTAVLSATILSAGLGSVATAQQADPKPDRVAPAWTTRPCPTEDSVNCYWDADQQGNGHGHSFIVRQIPNGNHMVCVFYVDRRYAKRHDYCS